MQTTSSNNNAARDAGQINEVIPGSSIEDFTGKTVVVREKFFSAKYANGDRRFNARGGFGCNPVAMGQAVMGEFVCDGEECRINRCDIEGLAVNQVGERTQAIECHKFVFILTRQGWRNIGMVADAQRQAYGRHLIQTRKNDKLPVSSVAFVPFCWTAAPNIMTQTEIEVYAFDIIGSEDI